MMIIDRHMEIIKNPKYILHYFNLYWYSDTSNGPHLKKYLQNNDFSNAYNSFNVSKSILY